MRAFLLAIVIACVARAEPPHEGLAAVPARLRAPLATATSQRVWLTWYGEKNGLTRMKGNARSFDDVSEFMRALNNLVECPKGPARVVERDRKGGFRVELIGGRSPAPVLDVAPGDVEFLFKGFELTSTVKVRDLVEFELTFRPSP